MRILFVSPFVPSVIKIRPYNFVRYLGREHAVTVVAPVFREQDRDNAAGLQQWCERVVTVPISRSRRLANYLRAGPSREPVQAVDCDTPALRAAIAAAARGMDVLHVEHLRAVRPAEAAVGLPRVWDAIDSITLLFRQAARLGPNLQLRAIARFELARTARFEAREQHAFQRVLVTSGRDLEAFRGLPGGADAPLRVLPNGVDLEYFRPARTEREPDTVLISGTMDYHPNVSAVLYLAGQVMPDVWRERPGARLVVAGAHPTRQVQALAADPRILVTGFVPDMRDWLARAAVAVGSTIYGAGIQNKALEAMAMATPVVLTPSSAAGLTATPGAEYLLGETPPALAAAIAGLLANPERARQLGAAGRAYVERAHHWPTLTRELVAEYELARDLAGASRSRPA